MLVSFTRGRRIAVDVGKARIGVAVCDPDGILASPVKTIQRSNKNHVIQTFRHILEEFEPIQVFVGLPLNMRNEVTESTRDAIEVGGWFKEISTIEVLYVDERLSTASAKSSMREVGRSEKSSRSIIDQQAACIILETALAALKAGKSAGLRLDELPS